MHNITNQYATLDGDDAEVWSYAVALHFVGRPTRTGTDLAMGVQYRDQARRTAAGWVVARRDTVMLWSR